MAEITCYKNVDIDAGTNSTTSATEVELTGLTVSWSDLTTAGFANGEEVAVLVNGAVGNSAQYTQSTLTLQQGSSFPGTTLQTSISEPLRADASTYNKDFQFVRKVTLTTNDQFFFGLTTETATTTTAYVDDFSIWVIRLDDLTSDQWKYAEILTVDSNIVSADGDVDGASVTLPSDTAQKWGFWGSVEISSDNTGSNSQVETEFSIGGTKTMTAIEGFTATGSQHAIGLVDYLESSAGSDVCKIVYSSAAAASNSDVESTAIFALNLDAFVDPQGTRSTSPVSVSGSFVQVNDEPTFTLTSTGNVMAVGQELADVANLYDQIRVQVTSDNTEFVTGYGNAYCSSYWGSGTTKARKTFMVYDSLTSGTLDIEVDGQAISGAFDFDEHALMVFSLEMVNSTPVIDTLTATVQSPTHITGTFNTDANAGTQYVWATANATEDAADVVSNGTLKAVTASGSQSYLVTATPGSSVYVHVVHQNSGNNSNVLDSSQKTMLSAYTESAVYSGSAIPSDSILYVNDGTHTGANNASILTDSTKTFTVDELIGLQAYNVTDVSFATVTDNDATTVTGTLAGGTDNDWDTNDVYQLLIMADSPDVMYCEATVTCSSEAGSLKFYIFDNSTSTYSATGTLSLSLPGYADGVYDVTLDTEGTPTLAAQAGDETAGAGGANASIMSPIIRRKRKKKKQRQLEKMDHDKSVEDAIAELYGKIGDD